MKYIVLTFITFLLWNGLFSAQAQFRQSAKKSPRQSDIQPTPTSGEYIIGGIDITGLNVLDKSAIISLTGLSIGDKINIPGEATGTAIHRLWKHGLVGDVSLLVDRIEGNQIFLTFHLSERPRLSDFYFTGINRSKQATLKEDLELIRGRIVNDAMIRNAQLAVKKHFVKKGFLNTQVDVITKPDTLSRGNVRLEIRVQPNEKVKIKQIHFEGNQFVSNGQLKRKMKKTHEYSRISIHRAILRNLLSLKLSRFKYWADSGYAVRHRNRNAFIADNLKLNIFSISKFIPNEYDNDKKKILKYYNKLGYRDVEILQDTVVRVNKKNRRSSVEITMDVHEGHKYYVRNLTWKGNYVYSTDILNKVLNIKKGDIYDPDFLNKRLTFDNKSGDISGLYMDDGYLFFRATPVEIAVTQDSIDIEIRLFEGEQATIRSVGIEGNERTNERVIRRELYTIPGQKFSRSNLIRTQQRLSQTGFIDPQGIEPNIQPSPEEGTVDINWKIKEQSNDQVQLSGGWGGFYGFVGTVGFNFNNFSIRNAPHWDKWRPLPFGDGQRLSIQAQANGRSFQSYSISFTEPWLGGFKPHSLTVSLNRSISRNITNQYTFARSDYYLKQTGITVGLGRRLNWPDNYFSLTQALSFLVYDYKNYFSGSNVLPNQGQTYQLRLENTFARNSIDNPYYPASGSTISLSLSLTPPYSLWLDQEELKDVTRRNKWVELHKWMFDSKFYLKLLGSPKPTGRSLVLEAKVHFGFIGSYTSQVSPGPFERFFVGGSGLAGGFNSFVLGQEIIGLRGYPDNQITPPSYGATTRSQNQEIRGGIVYSKYGIELRYPVVIGQTATIYGMMFTEAGNNWNDYKEVNPFDIYRAVGFGVRLFMPAFGLIGLNWAYGFDTIPYTQSPSGPQFHFTIGPQIR